MRRSFPPGLPLAGLDEEDEPSTAALLPCCCRCHRFYCHPRRRCHRLDPECDAQSQGSMVGGSDRSDPEKIFRILDWGSKYVWVGLPTKTYLDRRSNKHKKQAMFWI